MNGYTMRVETPLGYQAAVARVREALDEQGFGVLTEIDVRATMKAKLDVDVPAPGHPRRLPALSSPSGP